MKEYAETHQGGDELFDVIFQIAILLIIGLLPGTLFIAGLLMALGIIRFDYHSTFARLKVFTDVLPENVQKKLKVPEEATNTMSRVGGIGMMIAGIVGIVMIAVVILRS